MFSYPVLTADEANQERYQLLKEGLYDAVIGASQDKVSQNSGNPMMDMTVTVYDENGREHNVRDYLVFTKTMMWKVIHCAESAGILKLYEEGKFCSDSIRGCRVKVKIGIEGGSIIPEDKLKSSPVGSRYPDKNKIEDYLSPETLTASDKGQVVDDDIPF
jgi:hypothetical protein